VDGPVAGVAVAEQEQGEAPLDALGAETVMDPARGHGLLDGRGLVAAAVAVGERFEEHAPGGQEEPPAGGGYSCRHASLNFEASRIIATVYQPDVEEVSEFAVASEGGVRSP
jgi:hypothetical protein